MNHLNKGLLFAFIFLFSQSVTADSFRCGNALVKVNDTINALMKKCGDPDRQYRTHETINDHGRRYDAGVTHWVYERKGKKDMIVSVRNGVIMKIKPD
jgi:hypothetical protein